MVHTGKQLAVLQKVEPHEVWRRFEQGMVSSAFESTLTQVRERSGLSDEQIAQSFELDQDRLTSDVSQGVIPAAKLVVLQTIFGVELAPRTHQLSSGCIEAMKYVRQRMTVNPPTAELNASTLSYVAAFFSSNARLTNLLAGEIGTQDTDLRGLLKDWGDPFVICVVSLRSHFHWPELPIIHDVMEEFEEPSRQLEGSAEWSQEDNARRCELIDKKIQGNLTQHENGELELLQKRLRSYVNEVEPLPIEGARRLHRQLLEKAKK